MTSRFIWDAVVVGSGATGGVAAQRLSYAGCSVLVLEAGPDRPGFGNYASRAWNLARQLQRHYVSHRQSTQERHATYWTTNPDYFVDDVDNPYTTPENAPFRWIRGRQVGGRTHTWDGVTPRFSDHEFKAARLDSFGPEWPIEHADLAPHYGELERALGVHGSNDGLTGLPDGDYQKARPLTAGELQFKRRVEANFPNRHVLPSRGLRAGRQPLKGEAHTRLSSQATSLRSALETGRVQLRPSAMAVRVLYDGSGRRASGVEVIDTITHQRFTVEAKLVFLCASTVETVRLLLNSHDSQHPGGLGASSGVLGHYLMDHLANTTYFAMVGLLSGGPQAELLGSDSILIPRYQNLGQKDAAHLRGYGFWGGIERLPFPRILRRHGDEAIGFLCARSEALPHFSNQITLNPDVKDAWGQSVPHIDVSWHAEDLTIAAAAHDASVQMIEAAGGRIENLVDLIHMPVVGGFIRKMQAEWLRSTPGLFVHEVGGARMGTSPDNSVVNHWSQVWDAPNVYVTDGACWPSCGWQNPTLTEMAITARAAVHASAELQDGRSEAGM